MQSSVGGSMKRVNTVASALKRFFSKEDGRPNQNVESATGARIPASPSGTSLSGSQKVPIPPGSVRIADQVIEEVDEQLTITSMKGQPDVRPTAASLFATGPPTPSAPVDVPRSGIQPYTRTQSAVAHGDRDMALGVVGLDDLLSTSAPTGNYRTITPPGLDEYDKKRSGSRDSAMSGDSNKLPGKFFK